MAEEAVKRGAAADESSEQREMASTEFLMEIEEIVDEVDTIDFDDADENEAKDGARVEDETTVDEIDDGAGKFVEENP